MNKFRTHMTQDDEIEIRHCHDGIETVVCEQVHPEYEALILAAPDLMEALEKVEREGTLALHELDKAAESETLPRRQRRDMGSVANTFEESLTGIRAALARARGETT